MKLELSNITGILVDKWYQPKPGTISIEIMDFTDDADYLDEEHWIKFEYGNEIYLFSINDIKGLKYGS